LSGIALAWPLQAFSWPGPAHSRPLQAFLYPLKK
jgi:hypothetical protein